VRKAVPVEPRPQLSCAVHDHAEVGGVQHEVLTRASLIVDEPEREAVAAKAPRQLGEMGKSPDPGAGHRLVQHDARMVNAGGAPVTASRSCIPNCHAW
jgi:hypothetical protein